MSNTANKHRPTEGELTAQMRKFFFSTESITEAMESGTPRQLEFLHRVLYGELQRRDDSRKTRMVKNAGFPSIKNIEDYDFSNVSFPALMGRDEVLSLQFIEQRRTLIFYGICGSGNYVSC